MELWSFNGVDLNTKAWAVESILDGVGSPGFRGEDLAIPYLDGKRPTKKMYNDRKIMLGMWVAGVSQSTGRTSSGKTMKEQLYENIDYLTKIFGIRGVKDLIRTMPNGEIRTGKAEVYSSINFQVKPEGYAKFTVEFAMADPFFYTDEIIVSKIPNSTNYSFFLDNPGTAPIRKMTLILENGLDHPKIANNTSGIYFKLNKVIADGETVTIDTEKFTAVSSLAESGNMINTIVHSGDMSWFVLDAGSNSIIITNETMPMDTGKITFKYKPAYF